MAAMLERAVGFGRYRRRFTSRFSDLADLLRQASYLARRSGALRVGHDHVTAATAARRRRHGLSEERVFELVTEGLIHVATTGSVVGQVNGLTVYDLGHHRFGRPARITARVGLGREGVINVERQSGLSGPTHDKGVQILSGFLRGTFAQRAPLTMSCSVTFEQSYGGIDGDSASSTEIYAIVSALADLPLRQDIAVTGSVSQKGEVQPIGGVNEKIEGFFDVCRARGLTGKQGVMMPELNVGDLMLRKDVVQAVEEGKFHIYPVKTIDEGIEILTGVKAGAKQGDGQFEEGSVNALVDRKLIVLGKGIREFESGGEEGAKEEEKKKESKPS
jgi:predicted ATP-dependent protease